MWISTLRDGLPLVQSGGVVAAIISIQTGFKIGGGGKSRQQTRN